jgi:hypothetical protein
MVSNFGFYSPNFIKNMSASGKILGSIFSLGYIVSCILGLSSLYIYKIEQSNISKLKLGQINSSCIVDTIATKLSTLDVYMIIIIILIISYFTIFILFLYLCGSIVEIYTNNLKKFGIKQKTSFYYRIALNVYKKLKRPKKI